MSLWSALVGRRPSVWSRPLFWPKLTPSGILSQPFVNLRWKERNCTQRKITPWNVCNKKALCNQTHRAFYQITSLQKKLTCSCGPWPLAGRPSGLLTLSDFRDIHTHWHTGRLVYNFDKKNWKLAKSRSESVDRWQAVVFVRVDGYSQGYLCICARSTLRKFDRL